MLRLLLARLAAVALLAPAPGAAEPAGDDVALAFSRNGALFVAAADGTGARRVSARGYQPDWSPDGRRIAYVADWNGRESIYVMNADGRNVRRLTRGLHDLEPEWSPDGRSIAFTRDNEIWTMRADGSVKLTLIRKRLRWHEHRSPAWSRNTFVYASNRAGFFNQELYAAPARRLTFTKGSEGVFGDDGMPAFSPNGRQIAFVSNRTQDGEIWVMSRSGSGQRQLTRRKGDDFQPAWTADGRAIAFNAVGTGWIMQVNADGSGLRRLVRGTDPAFRPASQRSTRKRATIAP
jgi:TolB protein